MEQPRSRILLLLLLVSPLFLFVLLPLGVLVVSGIVMTALISLPLLLMGIGTFRIVLGRTASVDKVTSGLTRLVSSLVPLSVLREGSVRARKFLKLSIELESKYLSFDEAPLGESYNIESISYCDPTSESGADELSFVYFHGGAFSVCDSGDLLVCERLLPQIQKFSGAKKVTMYSVLYTLANPDQRATYPVVHDEVLRSYDAIALHLKSTGKRGVVAFVGDSAGANLCYCLAMQLLHRSDTEAREKAHVPALVLISPWFNCANDAYRRLLKEDAYRHDILSWEFIRRSRINYFGPSGCPPTSTSVEVGTELETTTLPTSCIDPWLTRTDSHLTKALPSIYCVAGTQEVFVEEITEFWYHLQSETSPGSANINNIAGGNKGGTDEGRESEENHKKYSKTKRNHGKVTFAGQAEGGRVRRRLNLVQGEIHAFPLFWQHPVRRVLGPFHLHWLFELLYPVPSEVIAKGAVTDSTSPAILPPAPRTPGEVERASIWKDVSTPKKPTFSASKVPSLLSPGTPDQESFQTSSWPRVDSLKADAAIEEIARFISHEYEAMC
jgi:acetyl esterase/lipase